MFDILILNPLANLLVAFYELLGGNLGLSIIVFTIFIRLLMLPLTIKQINTQKKMAELQPKLQELQSRRKDASQMSPEELAVMKQTAGGCLGGILPLIIQIPLFLGLYNVINTLASSKTGDVLNNRLYFEFLKHDASYHFNTQFLGFDLAGIPSNIGFNIGFVPYGILLLLLVVTQIWQSRLMNKIQQSNKKTPTGKKKANQKKVSKEDQEKQQMQEEMQKMMNLQMTYMLPVVIGIASWSFPAALSLYWLVQNLFAIAQMHVQINGFKSLMFWNRAESKADGKVVQYEDVKQ